MEDFIFSQMGKLYQLQVPTRRRPRQEDGDPMLRALAGQTRYALLSSSLVTSSSYNRKQTDNNKL